MTKVICLGLAVWDQIFTLEQLPRGGGKNFATSFSEVGGGPAATAAAAAARLGADSALWSRVGGDDIGRRILDDLQSYGVDTADVRRFQGKDSGLAVVLIDAAGERMIVTPGDPGLDSDPSWLPLEKTASADVVLADLRWPQGARRLLEAARQSGTTSVLDADLTSEPEAIASLIETASHSVFSAPSLQAFTGQEDPKSGLATARDKTQGVIAVTAGAKGCFWIDGAGEAGHQPAFSVEAVDTLGAGDVFHGAFAVALAERQPLPRAMRFAAAAAALKCTRSGGRAGTPDRAELDAFLRDNSDASR